MCIVECLVHLPPNAPQIHTLGFHDNIEALDYAKRMMTDWTNTLVKLEKDEIKRRKEQVKERLI